METRSRLFDKDVSFQGLVLSGQATVDLQILDNGKRRFDTFAHSTRNDVAMVDGDGDRWYQWSTRQQLPVDKKYWTVSGSPSHRMAQATLAVSSDGLKSFTFDKGEAVTRCASTHGSSVYDIISHCRSQQGQKLKVSGPCGEAHQSCCPIYNEIRTHSCLGRMIPAAFAEKTQLRELAQVSTG